MPSPEDKKIQVNETLKNDLIANAEKQRQLRDALIEEMRQDRLQQSEIADRIKREDYDAKAAKYWDDGGNDPTTCVASWIRANCGTGKGFEAYHDFTSSMMSLCGGLALLNKAMAYDNLGERGMKFIWAHTLEDTIPGQLIEGLGQMHLMDQLGDKIARGVGARKSPVLVYSVHIDENGKLTSTVTKNGEPLPEDQQMHFDTGLIAWFKVRGCEFDVATQIIKDQDGNIMTPEKLVEMNRDDENGLTAFFEDRMDVETSPSPRP